MLNEALTSDADKTLLYLKVANMLREQIDSGELDPGQALPSERDLSQTTGMSRVTIRKGIEQLIEEGFLVRRRGSGTFVMRRIEAPGATLSGFSDDAISRGEDPGVIWMLKSYASPTEEEATVLGVKQSATVVRLGRVRLSAGEPLAIEHAVVPAEFLPNLDTLGDSLYDALERTGSRPVAGTQKIRASLATPTEAGMLCIRQNSEILRIERLTRNQDGRLVEFTRSAYRGDRYDFVTELNPKAS